MCKWVNLDLLLQLLEPFTKSELNFISRKVSTYLKYSYRDKKVPEDHLIYEILYEIMQQFIGADSTLDITII